ncbi:MAG: hypothetical protein C3F11_21185 [Methylocystaceae bacterium]|nr:MAG: hypothetical protein C3F11_21185 [Methylocystaceae bacterium]
MRNILTRDETESVEHVLKALVAAGEGVRYGRGDPRHIDFLRYCAIRSGHAEQRYPALFQTIAAGATSRPEAVAGAFADGERLDFVSTHRRTGNIHARATVTRVDPVARMALWLQIFDQSGGSPVLLASGSSDVFDRQTATIETIPADARSRARDVTLQSVISYVIYYQDGTTESGSTGRSWSHGATRDPVIQDPAIRSDRTQGDRDDIVIGLARGFGSLTDVDYWFWEENKQDNHPSVLVPFTGSIQFDFPIAPLSDGNPILQFYLSRQEGGTSDLTIADTQKYRQFFQLDPQDPSNRTIKFALRATAADAGNAIDFGPSPWVSDTKTFFSATVTVRFADPSNGAGWASVVSSTSPNADQTDGVAYIKPIVYVWHCLVAGTQITLADGSTKPIEDFEAGDIVLSGERGRRVQATLAQPHSGPVVVLTFDNGAVLRGSGTHPVFTPGSENAVQAASLRPGDKVATANGGSTSVVSVDVETVENGGLFNLWLETDPPGPTIMAANGVLVGDYQIQTSLLEKVRNDPEFVRAKLPKSLHADYASWLEDRANAR